MHNPFEVAKQVAEVDQLSNGRFIFGIGVGWFEEEFEVLGQNFRNRGARTDDAIELMRKLWADDPVTYRGRFYSCEDASFSPKPVQRPASAHLGGRREPPRLPPGGAIRRGVPSGADAGRQGGRDARGDRRPVREVRPRHGIGEARRQACRSSSRTSRASSRPQGTPRQIVDGIRRYIDVGAEHFTLDFVPEKLDRRARRAWSASSRRCGRSSIDRAGRGIGVRLTRLRGSVGRISRRRNPTSCAPSPRFMSDYAALIRPTDLSSPESADGHSLV